jgi:CheY-like chemotaxis protein
VPDCLPGDYVMLSVSDTGHGMDAATRTHLFEPFFTTKEQGKGTGLGLATVFGIVQQNRGFITVESEPGQGATFRVFLPRASGECAAPDAEPAAASLEGSELILLVEDEAQILHLGRRILTRQGYSVLAAATPELALELAGSATGSIQLLMTDVVMPGMNGKELWLKLRDRHPGMKCLFMSGYTADVISQHGMLEPGVDFLQKPFTSRELVSKVREVLGPG